MRFPTGLTGDGSGVMLPLGTVRRDRDTEIDYSSACVSLCTDSNFDGHVVHPPYFSGKFHIHTTIYQMTFAVGRSDDIMVHLSPQLT